VNLYLIAMIDISPRDRSRVDNRIVMIVQAIKEKATS